MHPASLPDEAGCIKLWSRMHWQMKQGSFNYGKSELGDREEKVGMPDRNERAQKKSVGW